MTSQRPHRLRAWMVHLTVAALLLAQSLGLQHRVVHQPGGPFVIAGASAQATPAVAALFSGHTLDADCRLFDQLTHGDMASLPVLAMPCDFSEAPRLATVPCGRTLAPARSYCARDPPASA
jgi:hypothetical protein